MEQAIRLPERFHVRTWTAMYLLAVSDLAFGLLALTNVVEKGPSMSILLANEVPAGAWSCRPKDLRGP